MPHMHTSAQEHSCLALQLSFTAANTPQHLQGWVAEALCLKAFLGTCSFALLLTEQWLLCQPFLTHPLQTSLQAQIHLEQEQIYLRPELSRSTVRRIIWWERYQGSDQENLRKEIKTDICSQNYNIHFKLVLAEIYIYPRQSNYIIALFRNDCARLNTCHTLCRKPLVFRYQLWAMPLPQLTTSPITPVGGFAL